MANTVKETLNKRLVYLAFLQREENIYHHTYNEELLQYEYVKNGDMRSVEESKRLFRTGITGQLSRDPLRGKKYLFVASITLVTRFCIEGGLKEETAYNLSDLYIQHVDLCGSVEEVDELHTNMIIDFTERMAELKCRAQYSPPIAKCMDYIYYHLHSRITLEMLAEHVSLSPSYLSSLFKQEKGMSIQEYIRTQKIETAKNMLLYSDYSLTEIGQILAFSSSSHFIRVFRQETGITPKEFQRRNFRKHWN